MSGKRDPKTNPEAWGRLELPTSGLQIQRSIQLSYQGSSASVGDNTL